MRPDPPGVWWGEPALLWANSGSICVYGHGNISEKAVSPVVSIINEVLKEFELPVCAKVGNIEREDMLRIDDIVNAGLDANHGELDFDAILRRLTEMRKEEFLVDGIVILEDHLRFKFTDPVARYGLGCPTGLVILLRFDIKNAVRHEIGHIVGLGGHHSGCVMDYTCLVSDFCEDCRTRVRNMWKS